MGSSLPHLPRWAVVKGHDAALDFIADSYFEETRDCVVLANGHGVKTISFALFALLDLTPQNISIPIKNFETNLFSSSQKNIIVKGVKTRSF
ncbi:hypothetical protein ES702_02683 [subsurface metagenome]